MSAPTGPEDSNSTDQMTEYDTVLDGTPDGSWHNRMDAHTAGLPEFEE
jgi:hypothetical protein